MRGAIAAASADWLAAALPALALGDAPGEHDITPVCELALLLRLAARGGVPDFMAALTGTLPDWVAAQARHPAIHALVGSGPALALTAPLLLHAALGKRSPFDPAALRRRAFETGVLGTSPLYWRQLELAELLEVAGIPGGRGNATPFLDQPDPGFDERAAYAFTHEVFHQTRFARRPGPAPWHARALAYLDRSFDAVIGAGHADLTAEYVAASACLGVPVEARRTAAAKEVLSGLARAWDQPLRSYHPHLVVLVAVLCGSRLPLSS